MYGTLSKPIDFIPSEKADGLYESEILPTRTGTYSVLIKGKINGQPVDNKFDIERVETKEGISFPDKVPGTQSNISPKLQAALNQLANQNDLMNRKIIDVQNRSLNIEREINNVRASLDMLYLISAVGIGAGVGGAVIAAYFVYHRIKDK